jgi:hypothetical protein
LKYEEEFLLLSCFREKLENKITISLHPLFKKQSQFPIAGHPPEKSG